MFAYHLSKEPCFNNTPIPDVLFPDMFFAIERDIISADMAKKSWLSIDPKRVSSVFGRAQVDAYIITRLFLLLSFSLLLPNLLTHLNSVCV